MILREPEVPKFFQRFRASRIALIFRALHDNTKLTYDFAAPPQEGSRFSAKNLLSNDELQGKPFALRKRGAWIETGPVRRRAYPTIRFRPPETGSASIPSMRDRQPRKRSDGCEFRVTP